MEADGHGRARPSLGERDRAAGFAFEETPLQQPGLRFGKRSHTIFEDLPVGMGKIIVLA